MESSHFVIIPCRVCCAKTLILGDRRRPVQCARCRAPYDAASESFRARPHDAPPPSSPSDRPRLDR